MLERMAVLERGEVAGYSSHGKEKERTFDSRVVFVDEVALDELDGQARLSDATTTDDDELVFTKELLHREGRAVSRDCSVQVLKGCCFQGRQGWSRA